MADPEQADLGAARLEEYPRLEEAHTVSRQPAPSADARAAPWAKVEGVATEVTAPTNTACSEVSRDPAGPNSPAKLRPTACQRSAVRGLKNASRSPLTLRHHPQEPVEWNPP